MSPFCKDEPLKDEPLFDTSFASLSFFTGMMGMSIPGEASLTTLHWMGL
jgi:hypothetical protein